MKFIIFADKSYNYIRPIADGLHKTLLAEGHESAIWYNGIHWLGKPNLLRVFATDIYRLFMNIKTGFRKRYLYRFFGLLFFYTKKKRSLLNNTDCIIVVSNCPSVFYADKLVRIEYLREKYNKPIVNYDFHYLPNQAWYKRISQNENNYGLERFDWYLPIGLVTEYSIPEVIPQIYTCIGMDIKKFNLFPEKKEFRALVDFKRKGYEKERKIVIDTLEELSIPYTELNGKYTTDEIRQIYRNSSIYFVSCRESFGLPIVEMQLCGGYVFTPFKEWCPAHFLDKSPYENGYGRLGDNFAIYENNKELLIEKILQIKYIYNSQEVIDRFENEYPYYNSINLSELSNFIDKLQKGEIDANSHKHFKEYNKFISTEDDVILY